MKKIIIIILVLFIAITAFLYYDNNMKKKNEVPNNSQKNKMKETNKLEDQDVKQSIFKNSYKKAIKTVSNMTIEEKVGQLFLVRYDKDLATSITDNVPGGYILFAKDFENKTKTTMKDELNTLQKSSKYPLIFGVDEEGGFVTRVSKYPAFRSEKFLSPRAYYNQGGYELLEVTEKEKAQLLKEIGINLNLAPVADVSTNPNDFIYNRSFQADAQTTANYIEKMVEYANNNQINACLKHFPGYGNNVDTHTGIAIDNRPYESFQTNDFLPFKAGIKKEVPSILVSHNIMTAIDNNYPSSLSEKVIGILRNELNHTGIIMTDDLAMDAVKSYVEEGKAATLAINAGNDMIITSDFKEMYNEVLQSVKDNNISIDKINKAVIRIMAWKYESST